MSRGFRVPDTGRERRFLRFIDTGEKAATVEAVHVEQTQARK